MTCIYSIISIIKRCTQYESRYDDESQEEDREYYQLPSPLPPLPPSLPPLPPSLPPPLPPPSLPFDIVLGELYILELSNIKGKKTITVYLTNYLYNECTNMVSLLFGDIVCLIHLTHTHSHTHSQKSLCTWIKYDNEVFDVLLIRTMK